MTEKSRHNNSTRDDVLLSKIQAMSESDFTFAVLVPLFKTMGYQVDYHGGPNEGGKDLICRKITDFDLQEICVVQVKKTTASAAAASNNSFAGIVTQLQQALEKKVPSLSGQEQTPNYVYFITPYEINTRSLETRFEAVKTLSARGIRILDGRLVVTAILSRLPDLAASLCGQDFLIKEKTLSNISNEDLLSALNYSNEKRVADFYCDLDFGVGKVTTKFFFSLDFDPTVPSFSIPLSRWQGFERIANGVSNLMEVQILHPNLAQANVAFEEAEIRWKSVENQKLVRKINEISNEIKEIFSSLIDECAQIVNDALSDEINLREEKITTSPSRKAKLNIAQSSKLHAILVKNSKLSKDFSLWCGFTELNSAVHQKIHATLSDSEKHIQEIREEASILNATSQSRLNKLLRVIPTIGSRHQQLYLLMNKTASAPNYEISIDGSALAFEIDKQKKWIANGIDNLANFSQSPSAIKSFFLKCQNIFETVGNLLDNNFFADALGYKIDSQRYIPEHTQRISMPIREVFATGIHCAVYGEAGAGKSTTLHQYAAFASKNNTEHELTLFLPLTRILSDLKDLNRDCSAIQKIEIAISKFLSTEKCKGDKDIIDFIKKKSKVTFIFDGVDEVIKIAPWIIEAINEIENNYRNCQIILSSRSSGSYIDNISYLALTLLPFTDLQVSHFIEGWFSADELKTLAVKRHLRETPALSEIVRNPLLVTVLCVLAENNVPLPDSEMSMYSERLKLLLSHYDIHKKTKRITSHHHVLENISRKLAFAFHKKNIRYASAAEIERLAVSIYAKYSKQQTEAEIRHAVRELMDPCNILVPMNPSGDFGFGHLRYQEYLCAEELKMNRGIDIGPLLPSVWWRSVLVLFSRMTDDINYVINDVLDKQLNVTKCRDSLLAMIATQGKADQKLLRSIIDENAELDRVDQELKEYYDSEGDEQENY